MVRESSAENSFEDFVRAISRIKPTLTKEEQEEDQKVRRERKKTIVPVYGFDVTFCIIRRIEPVKCKFMEYEYETYPECRVVIKDDELNHWKRFWEARGWEMILCQQDWQQRR